MEKPSFNQLYGRQIILNEVGENGQNLLQKSNVLIIGCGGLGSAVAVYLAASGVGNIHLVDFDVVSVSNLHRQVFYTLEDVGKPKVFCLKNYIESISPFVKVTEDQVAISKYNIAAFVKDAGIIVDCTDNLHIKYLINDVCVLHHKTLVYGSLHKFDGYVATFNHAIENGKFTANLRDAFPEIPEKLPPTCAEVGTLNTIVGIIALHQVNEVLKIILKKGSLLTNKLFIYNSLYHTTQTIQIQKRFSNDEISSFFAAENYIFKTCEVDVEIKMLNTQEFWDKLKQDNVVVLSFSGNLPHKKYTEKIIQLTYFSFDPFRMPIKPNHEYILICLKGAMSYDAALALVEAHPTLKVYNLENGIESLDDFS
ncbi:MAG: HesA/MoeB/ThiF family protein [Flavobacteriaceae bacterium]|nr:HesA/MoeB/ThiF family protein [Flavobacteriaceae bacterium]